MKPLKPLNPFNTWLIAVLVAGMSFTASAGEIRHHNCSWTPWVSEERKDNIIADCGWQKAAVGVQCKGKYCDKVRMKCCAIPHRVHTRYSSSWFGKGYIPQNAQTFIDANKYWGKPKPGLVQMLICRGGYCRTKKVWYYSYNTVNLPVFQDGSCYWYETGVTSKTPPYYCKQSHYMTGLGCKGKNCKKLTVFCCKPKTL